MSWFKIDDGFWSHPKILKLTPQAITLWVRAGSWCSAQLTDGRVEAHVMPMFLATPEAVAELVAARLWHVPGDRCEDCEKATTLPESGYLFHDWLKYQLSREEVLASREANRQRQIRHRQKTKEAKEARVSDDVSQERNDGVSHADRNGVTNVVSNDTPTRPDPTIEDQTLVHPEGELVVTTIEQEFDIWWPDYPRPQGRADALKAFRAARKKVSLEKLQQAVAEYKLMNIGVDRSKLKMAGGWLRDERWDDAPIVNTVAEPRQPQPSYQQAAYAAPPQAPVLTPPRRGEGMCRKHPDYPVPCDRCAADTKD